MLDKFYSVVLVVFICSCLAACGMLVYGLSTSIPGVQDETTGNIGDNVAIVSAGGAFGTGFQIGDVLLTNSHVCQEGTQVKILYYSATYTRKVLWWNKHTDICAVEGNIPYMPKLKLASNATIGEKVTVVGFPYGVKRVISTGILNNNNFLLNSDIHPGNSGSPVMNENGEIVGIISALNLRTMWGVIVPLDIIRKALLK